MINPYKIPRPALVSFSGGRTSGFMLWNILNAYDGKLPEDIHVVFANTGKEASETLDFINDISNKWNIHINWVEHYFGDERPIHRTKIVNYKTASRNGEPFERLIDQRQILPNPVARFCSSELKIKTMQRFMKKIKNYKTWYSVIGLRYDEPRRVVNARKANDYELWTNITPMYDAKHTVNDVTKFWQKSNFDLQLTNFDGKTPAGNCDLCFLKNTKTLQGIISERPQLADWWIKQESKFGKQSGAVFRKDRPNYIELVDITKQQINLFEDETIETCFCHD
tara:strand:+ start:43 stop:885 length:843 start_codon:yes stop_codon:yes gene_type:complete